MKSHVPREADELVNYLDAIESEADEVLTSLPTKWKQAVCLYRTGAPEAFGSDPPLFSANLIRPSLRTGAALVTETKPALDVKPRRDGLFQTSHLLRQTIDAGWDELNMSMQLEELQLMVDVLCSGFLCLTWNREAHYGFGNIAVTLKDPRQMKVDGAVRRSRDLDSAEYIIDRTVVPMHEVARAYPDIADDLVPCGKLSAIEDQDSRGANTGFGARIKGVYSRLRGGGAAGQGTPRDHEGVPRVELRTYWIRDPARDKEGPLYPNGRMIVRANDDLICEPDPTEQQNPYYDGLWPYEWLDGVPDLDSPWGSSETEAIKRIQETFNRVGNAGSQAILREARSWVIFDEGAIGPENVDKFVELGFRGVPKRRQYEFRHEPPGVNTQSIQGWMGMCQQLIDLLTGVRDSSGGTGGRGRAEVRSPALLEGLQQAQQVLIRAKARRLESFLERFGQKWVSRIFQFYTTDRLMNFVGTNMKWNTYKFEHAKLQSEIIKLALGRVNDVVKRERETFLSENPDEPPTDELDERGHLKENEILLAVKGAWRDFQFRIDPYSSLSSTRQQRAGLLKDLNASALVPGWMVTEELGYANAKELQQEALQEAKEKAESGLPALLQQQSQKKKPSGKGK